MTKNGPVQKNMQKNDITYVFLEGVQSIASGEMDHLNPVLSAAYQESIEQYEKESIAQYEKESIAQHEEQPEFKRRKTLVKDIEEIRRVEITPLEKKDPDKMFVGFKYTSDENAIVMPMSMSEIKDAFIEPVTDSLREKVDMLEVNVTWNSETKMKFTA
jgi:phage-related minor tail protein